MMNSALSSPLSLLSSETRRGLIADLQERLTKREAQRRAVEAAATFTSFVDVTTPDGGLGLASLVILH